MSNLNHVELHDEEEGEIHRVELQRAQIMKYAIVQATGVAVILFVGLVLTCAYFAPDQLIYLIPVLLLCAAFSVPLLGYVHMHRYQDVMVTLTDGRIVLVRPSICPRKNEIMLSDIQLVFTSDDVVQRCLSIMETHIITRAGSKLSIMGIKGAEQFVEKVKHQMNAPAPRTRVEFKRTLKEKAEAKEHELDVQSLEQLNRLDDLSLTQLNALEEKIIRLDKHLSNCSDQLSAKPRRASIDQIKAVAAAVDEPEVPALAD